MDSIHFIRGYGFGATHHLVGRTERGNKERTEKPRCAEDARLEKKEKEELEAFSSLEMPFMRENGDSRLTPSGTGGIGSRENYVSRGRKIGYVMELAEDRGPPAHSTLIGSASLEGTHYLHLWERK